MLTISLTGFLAFLQTSVFAVGYIASNNLFPEPLSNEEEKMYLEKMEKGDFTNLDTSKVTNIDQEDLISIGTIGLIKGINSYKINKGTKLSTYVSRCIDNEILMYLRATKKHRSGSVPRRYNRKR